jgi:Tfp pilus assembly protein PilF
MSSEKEKWAEKLLDANRKITLANSALKSGGDVKKAKKLLEKALEDHAEAEKKLREIGKHRK